MVKFLFVGNTPTLGVIDEAQGSVVVSSTPAGRETSVYSGFGAQIDHPEYLADLSGLDIWCVCGSALSWQLGTVGTTI